MATRIKLRRDINANWTANNPVLAIGEPGLVTDAISNNVKLKFGDGSTAWNALAFFTTGGGGSNKVTDAATIALLEDNSNWTNNLYIGVAIAGQSTGDWYDNGTISYKFITGTTVSRIPYTYL